MTTVALLDDHGIVLEGLGRLLERSGFRVVLSDHDPDRFLVAVHHAAPDLCILDLRLAEGRSGIDVAREVRVLLPLTRIAVLTSSEDGAKAAEAVRAGATGFVIKDAQPEALVERLAAVARGDLVLDGRVAQQVVAPATPAAGLLNDRERTVLKHIAAGLTNQQIAREMALSPHTVKDYVTVTMRKLGATSRAETVARAMAARLI
ncbi:response regulator [Nocardioides sp.]|uniref:response regulator n=1 Tax=Nocardioides sp. TaxID=35761 RepID=UPI00351924EA